MDLNSRLSSAFSSARAWLSSTQTQVRRYNQVLAENRRLKAELHLLRQERQADADEQASRIAVLQAEVKQLGSIVAEQDRELTERQREIERLEAVRDLARTQIDGLAEIHSGQSTLVQMLIAQHVAAATKATSNGHRNEGIGDLL